MIYEGVAWGWTRRVSKKPYDPHMTFDKVTIKHPKQKRNMKLTDPVQSGMMPNEEMQRQFEIITQEDEKEKSLYDLTPGVPVNGFPEYLDPKTNSFWMFFCIGVRHAERFHGKIV